MKRRNFVKSVFFAGGFLNTTPLDIFCSSTLQHKKSQVVVARDQLLQNVSRILDSNRLSKLIDKAMQTMYQTDNVVSAWRNVVSPGEIIGLKVNCLSGKGTTNSDLVDIICERLIDAGIKEENIVIWDRFNSDLEEAGFKIRSTGRGRRCLGNDMLGFESEFDTFGSAASLVCKTITRLCHGVINLPVLKDHGIAGVTIAMKNMFGAIHNPNKYHLNVGDPYIPDVYMLPSIRNKIRLTICDAINAQFEGGPSYMPHWSWPYNGVIVGKDPVALDYTGWQIIEEERKTRGLKSLKGVGREPKYIATAANHEHALGTNNPDLIEVLYV